MKGKLSFLCALVLSICLALVTTPVFAHGQEANYSGWSSQGQWFHNNIPGPMTYQFQSQSQDMEAGVINNAGQSNEQTVPLVNIQSEQNGLMMSKIGQNGGEVDLSTGNNTGDNTGYNIHIDTNGVTVGTSTDTSATTGTTGDAIGYSGSTSNINVTINL